MRSAAASSTGTCRSSARSRATSSQNNGRFSALVLGVVKSKPFQMNTQVERGRAATATARGTTIESKGVN